MSSRRTILDYPRNEAGLVDEFIGTAYDAMYTIYQNLDALLEVNLNTDAAVKAAEEARLSAVSAKAEADRAKQIVDDFLAGLEDPIDFSSLGIYPAQNYGLVGGEGIEESGSINRAIDACGRAGGGVVYVRAKADGAPIYIDKPVQIEYDNVILQFESPIQYGPKGTMRVSGGFKEIRRTELGQVDLIALAQNSTVDDVGEMKFVVRPGEGAYLRVGDRVTLRGENNAVGAALDKQTVTIKAIDSDTIYCYDVPELTFRAVYPQSEWEPDRTTGTTVSIVNYSAFTASATGPNILDVQVKDGTKFTVGELVYISDSRKERDLIQERDLVSAAVMEHAMIAKISGNTITFDRPIQRQYLRNYKGGISSLDAVFNSHILIKEMSWAAPQPDRKNSAVGINFGHKCSTVIAKMDGRGGRVGTAFRIAYSYDCEMHSSEIIGAYSFASAEAYGAVMYYSTFCRIRDTVGSGNRHNFLIQTCVSCDIMDNVSTDDYISGIDLHGAGALNCRIMGNRVSRSKNYSTDANIGGGIRNGNTSHVIGDHGTLIYNNYIEGYNNRNDANGRYESAAIDVCPSSQNVIVRDNHMVDCSIGFRHYRISPAILDQRVANRIVLIGNTFERISEKLVQMDIGVNGNSLVQELVLIDNKSINNAKQFEINDVPKVRLLNNQIIAPVVASGVYGFNVTNCQDLIAVGNFAAEANRGFRIYNCPGAKVFKNVLDLTREEIPFAAAGDNTGYIERGNTLADSGGSGATVQIGTVITSAPGTDAQVENVGTPQDAVLNFVIPRGIQGPPGTGGDGGGYTPGVNVTDLDALIGQAQRLLIFDSAGKLSQLVTGTEGRLLVGLETLLSAKEHLGIDQVDNTPDREKPVSDPVALALADKVDSSGGTFTGRPSAPHPATPFNAAYPNQLATALWTLDRIDEKIAAIPPAPSGAKAFKTFALLGDSLSGNNSDLGKAYTRGFLTFAQQLSGHRMYSDYSLNRGVGGETSAQIAARVNEILALGPDVCLVEMGGNDTSQSIISANSIITNIRQTVEALVESGIFVILCTIYPTAGKTDASTLKKVSQVNQWIYDASNRYNMVEVLDAHSVMFNNATGLVRAKYTYDTTHPGAYGSWFLGSALADKIKQMVPVERYQRLHSLNDKWALDYTTGNILTNAEYTGSTGTIVGTGGSGTIPSGLVLDMTNANGATAAVAVIPGNDGFNTLEITLGGTTTGTSVSYTKCGHILLGEVFGGTTAWNTTDLGKYLRDTAVNQLLQMECEVENLVGVAAVGVESFFLSAGGTNKPSNGDGLLTVNTSNPSGGMVNESLAYPTIATPVKLILRAEPEANTGKANGYKVGLHIAVLPGMAISGKIRITCPVFRAYPEKFI